MNSFTQLPSFLLIVALLVGTISCDTSNNSGEVHQVSVNMKLNTSNNSTAKQLTTSPSVQSVDSLTEVKILVEELELESTADDDSLDFEIDDFVVNLPLDGSEFDITSANVPAGVYEEFEMEFEYSDDTNVDDSDFIKESGDDDGYTIVIKGIYNGEEFMYRSEEDFEIELEFNPPFEVNNNSSIAINIDPTGWFTDSSGNDLDPNDPANHEEIDENIENSFEVEEDDDNNDDDDDDDDNDD